MSEIRIDLLSNRQVLEFRLPNISTTRANAVLICIDEPITVDGVWTIPEKSAVLFKPKPVVVGIVNNNPIMSTVWEMEKL